MEENESVHERKVDARTAENVSEIKESDWSSKFCNFSYHPSKCRKLVTYNNFPDSFNSTTKISTPN
jgi:hypothetical protein